MPAGAAEAASRVLRYAGSTGERLVLPWLLAGAHSRADDQTAQSSSRPSARDWDEAVRLARELTAEAWPFADDPSDEAHRILMALRGEGAGEALRVMRGLPGVDRTRATRAMTLFDRVGRHLAAAGALFRPDQLWALPPDEVRGLLAGDNAGDAARAARERHRAALRWEPFAFTAVMTEGERVSGVPASPGTGAGPVVFVAGRPRRRSPPPRAVIVAPRPLPHLAPLLWGASALVTFGGSVAAHLIEVARSLAVPAVVGCDAESLLGTVSATLAAVDGDHGLVAVSVPPSP